MADTDFNIGLVAQLDPDKSKTEINSDIQDLQKKLDKLKLNAEIDQSQLDNLKTKIENLSMKLNDVTISASALTNLVNQVNNALQSIQINNINISGGGRSGAQNAGQQLGKIISDSAEKSIEALSSQGIDKYFRVSPKTSNQFKSEMSKLVQEWTNGKGELKDVQIQTRTAFDENVNATFERLHQATVTYTNDLNEVIRKTIAWRQIGVTQDTQGNMIPIRGFVEVASQYSKSMNTVNKQTDNFINKQKTAVSRFENVSASIQKGYLDKNGSKPIKDLGNIAELNNQYGEVQTAIENLKNANQSTFTDMYNEVSRQVSILKDMVKEYRNAENVASSLKGTDFVSGKKIAGENYKKYKAVAERYDGTEVTRSSLETAWNNITDKASLDAFTDSLRVANAELSKLKTSVNEANKAEKVEIKADGLKSTLTSLQNLDSEFSTFEADINGAKVSITSLNNELENVKTPGELSVINEKYKAFVEAAKAAGLQVKESSVKEADAYDVAYQELKKLYDLKIQYAKIGSNKDSDYYYPTAISKQEEAYRQAKSQTSTPENWDIQKRMDLENQEYLMQQKLQDAYDKTNAKLEQIQYNIDTEAYSAQIAQVTSEAKKFDDSISSEKIEQYKISLVELQKAYEKIKSTKGDERVSAEKEYQKALQTSKNILTQVRAEYDKTNDQVAELKRTNLAESMQKWADNNTKAMGRYGETIQECINKLRDLSSVMSNAEFTSMQNTFGSVKSSARDEGLLGMSVFDKVKNAWQKFGGWSFATGSLMTAINKTKEAVVEFKNLDDIITEISKTSDMTTEELQKLGKAAFNSASDYGKNASDYLRGVMEMSRSGFYGEQGESMAKQSLLAQAAGDMTAELANNYVIATNAAYKFNGEAEKINDVIDGQNEITNRNSVAMQDMAEAMSEAGTVASSYRVSIKDLSAMIGTIEAVTKSGGSEVGNSIKSILINLQNVSSSKIVKTLDKANASMTEMVNGAEKLRNPIEILRDLADTFTKLDEDDPLRAEILTNVAGKYQASKLAALLQNMTMFDKMLGDYGDGSGSAMVEAQKSAHNLTGELNTLGNTWKSVVNDFVDAEFLTDLTRILNDLLSVVKSFTGIFKQGTIFSVLAGIAGAKGSGLTKVYQPISMRLCNNAI
ncbi:phage tail tape measure protein [Clostridium sp. AF32-12BH]|uniref:phage tail tape measure protein n=1 Tax=Clostridium sp. AF32-12BH TaxID=2292006 RepID=UPI000E4C2B1D|nr:phage tail tape measure protein [Clostridium sp. AF32-12BH]RHP47068.1 phage tail tape measure protein [Clostridium sp. AF32-12BH]